MTAQTSQQLIRAFFDAVSAGEVPGELLAPDMTFWSVSGGEADKTRFLGGIKLLAQVANQSIRYDIVSLTEEEDRLAAEIRSSGTLINGDTFQNNHMFLFRLHNGKIAHGAEYMDQMVVREKIAPLMQEAIAKAGQ